MACLFNSTDVRPNGVHYFSGDQVDVDPEEALILHYESCDFEEWKWKFSRPNPSNFEFYQESRDAIQKCASDSECLSDFYVKKTGFFKDSHKKDLWFLG